MMSAIFALFLLVLFVILLVFFVTIVSYFRLWLRAWLSDASVSWLSLIGMSLRKVNPQVIVLSKI
ncbi:MAG TPA: flotillin-like FloA family protein, partial [Candidatus Hydrogenedentes bacterium]|nr:flotillin-like FloA family protein [Candidatus Hydrogenedentota bacterium]